MRSLRRRLLFSTGIATAAVLSALAIALFALMRSSLLQQFDDSLLAKAQALAALVEVEKGKIELDRAENGMPEFERGEKPEYFQIWLADGRTLARSASLKGRDLKRPIRRSPKAAYYWTRLPDGRVGRMIYLRFYPQGDGTTLPGSTGSPERQSVTIAVARNTADIDRTLASLRLMLAGVCTIATVLSLGLLAWIVGYGLRPFNRFAAEIGRIGERDLSVRIDAGDVPAELLPVVERLNDLLGRLEAAFAREKSFSANVAHELRTPLAGLRSILEVALTRPRTPAEYRKAMEDCLQICQQTQSVAETLLALARIESGQVEISRKSVYLTDMLRDRWRLFAQRASERNLRVEWRIKDMIVQTDEEKLRLVIDEILQNAVTYTNEGGAILLQVGCEDNHAFIRVKNTGSRIAPEDADRVFDRFWRGDMARADTGIHCGLGLSLCREVMNILGGHIRAESTPDNTFRITLTF